MGLENEDNHSPPPTVQFKKEWTYSLHHLHQDMVLNTAPAMQMTTTTTWKGQDC
jgi:hypothetical protein